MEPQFKHEMTYRDGSHVEVQVGFADGITGPLTEKRALERAVELIGERIGQLDPEPDE